jgi:hypothetical protein
MAVRVSNPIKFDSWAPYKVKTAVSFSLSIWDAINGSFVAVLYEQFSLAAISCLLFITTLHQPVPSWPHLHLFQATNNHINSNQDSMTVLTGAPYPGFR